MLLSGKAVSFGQVLVKEPERTLLTLTGAPSLMANVTHQNCAWTALTFKPASLMLRLGCVK